MTPKKARKKRRSKRTLKDVVGEGITLRALLDAANAHYPDGFLTEFYAGDGDDVAVNEGGIGDTLAEAIVRNIVDTYPGDGSALEKTDAALHVIDRLVNDLDLAEKGLVELRERIEPGGLDAER